MEREKTLVVMMGLQGSGKSTFYRKFLATEYIHVNLDTLKTRHRESVLFNESVANGVNIAVDNTNPTKEDRARYISVAKESGYRIVGYFMESKLQVCVERNEKREGKARVPAKAIAATSNRLQIPSYDEGFDELYFVANDGENMTVSDWKIQV